MDEQQYEMADNVFSPQEVGTKAYRVVEERHANRDKKIKTGIGPIDDVLLPMRPGELVIVCGYTSNYKSGLMNYIARTNAIKLTEETADWTQDQSQAVVTLTWEQSVEEQGIVDIAQMTGINAGKMLRGELADEEWTALQRGTVDRGALPWWVIGHSGEQKKRRPRMTLSTAARALAYMVDIQGVEPTMIVLDYLQRIRPEREAPRREQIMEIVDRCKDMALSFGCPVMLGCQAGRGVKERQWKLPHLEDAQESSNVEQSADKWLSVWLPKTDFNIGETIPGPNGGSIAVTENLLVVGIMKQKLGPAPKIIFLSVRPEVNEILPMQTINLNQ